MLWKGKSFQTCLAVATICGATIQASSQSYAQYSSAPRPEVQVIAEPEGTAMGDSATTIIPSLRLAERYDSNVFFVQGGNLEDFVTTISPQMRVLHTNQWVEAQVSGGVTSEVYVKNPGLNYVGANGTVALNLDGAMNALLRGLSLHITNNGNYTPQPPAFAAPTSGNQATEAFVQGIQARRANSFMNMAKVEASYFFSPYLGITSTYNDNRIRFGRRVPIASETVQQRLIDTNFQTVTSGFVGRPTSADTISLLHQYRTTTFSDPDRGERGFSTQGAIARWSRFITPSLQLTLEGGFSVLLPNRNVYTMGGASLQWRGQYTDVVLSYSRAITPSFLFASTALLSQVVTGTVSRQLAEPFSLSLSGSYAVNEAIPDSSFLRFESYSVTPGLEYQLGRSFTVRLAYTRSEFQRALQGRSVEFDRNMVMLSLLAEWR